MTQDELKQHLHYDPETGVFTWRDRSHMSNVGHNVNCRTKGKVAGSINKSGYWRINLHGKGRRAHRLAWLYVYGYMPEEVDHIDGCRTNNRICNLRAVDRSENAKNMRRMPRNTSGFSGVHFNQADQVWIANITVNQKRIHGGRFKTKDEAINRRRELERQYGFHENHGRD